MAIDTTEKPIDIKRLVIEEGPRPQESRFLYNPRQEIGANDRKGALDIIRSQAQTTSWAVPMEEVAQYRVLFPDQPDETADMLPLFEYQLNTEGGYSLTYPYAVKLLFPTQYRDLMHSAVRVPYDSFRALKEAIEIRVALKEGGNLIREYLLNAFILYPNQFGELKALPGLKELLETEVKDQSDRYRRRVLSYLAPAAAAQRLCFGKGAITLTEEDWRNVKDQLEYKRENHPDAFIEQAFEMALIAADKVEMTDQGLRLAWDKEPVKDKASPMPEARKF